MYVYIAILYYSLILLAANYLQRAQALQARVELCVQAYAEYQHLKLEMERVVELRRCVAAYTAPAGGCATLAA
jgi:hypothetical protein